MQYIGEKEVEQVIIREICDHDPKQRFQSSLPIGRVGEDPPGKHSVVLCYKLNNQWLTSKRGGPVRVLVPDGYGNKSAKWLQRIMPTRKVKHLAIAAEILRCAQNDSHHFDCQRAIDLPGPAIEIQWLTMPGDSRRPL